MTYSAVRRAAGGDALCSCLYVCVCVCRTRAALYLRHNKMISLLTIYWLDTSVQSPDTSPRGLHYI